MNPAPSAPPPEAGEPDPAEELGPLPEPLLQRYQISEELLGEGSGGQVHRAWDRRLSREVAIKILRDPRADIQTFYREAKITARLDSPGVVPIYEVGRRPDGRPWCAMRLIRGRTLRHLLADATPPALDLLPALLSVCQTVGAAHALGVIHGDLQPGRIMVSPQGETVVLGWGRLRSAAMEEVQEGSSLTVLGAPRGTPGYLSPEAARGLSMDARSDLWSLGAILHELLCGQPLIPGHLKERLLATAAGRYHPTDQGHPALVALLHRVLAPEPEARPRDATALAEELRGLLAAGVGAPPPSRPWLRRWAAPLAALAALGALGLGLGAQRALEVRVERDMSRRGEEQARQRLGQSWERGAEQALERRELPTAWLLASASLSMAEDPAARGRLIAADSGWMPLSLQRLEPALGRCSRLAAGPRGLAALCEEGLWTEGRELSAPGGPALVSLGWTAQGLLAQDALGWLWAEREGQLEEAGRVPGNGLGISQIAPDLAALALPSAARAWLGAQPGPAVRLPLRNESLQRWSPDGLRVAAGGWGELAIYSWPDGAEQARMSGPGADVRLLAWSSDGAELYSGGAGSGGRQSIWRWSAEGGGPLSQVPVGDELLDLEVLGGWLAALSPRLGVSIYALPELDLVARLPAEGGTDLAFSQDGRELAVATALGIDRWALPPRPSGSGLRAGEAPLVAAALVGGQPRAVDEQGRIWTWPSPDARAQLLQDLHLPQGLSAALVLPDGRAWVAVGAGHLYAVGADGTFRRLELEGRTSTLAEAGTGLLLGLGRTVVELGPEGTERRRCEALPAGLNVDSLRLAGPDLAWVAAQGRRWALDLGSCALQPELPRLEGLRLFGGPAGQPLLYGGDAQGGLHRWSLPGNVDRPLAGHSAPPRALAVGPRDQPWISGDRDGELILWSAQDQPLARWPAHSAALRDLMWGEGMVYSAAEEPLLGRWRFDRLQQPGSGLLTEGCGRFSPLCVDLGLQAP